MVIVVVMVNEWSIGDDGDMGIAVAGGCIGDGDGDMKIAAVGDESDSKTW